MDTVTCPKCGEEVPNPGNTEIVVCPGCHTPIEVEEVEEE